MNSIQIQFHWVLSIFLWEFQQNFLKKQYYCKILHFRFLYPKPHGVSFHEKEKKCNRHLGESTSPASVSVGESEERTEKQEDKQVYLVIYRKIIWQRNWPAQSYSGKLQHNQEANHSSGPKSYYRFLTTRLVFLLQLQIINSILKL